MDKMRKKGYAIASRNMKLPCRVDEMTAREFKIFELLAGALGRLEFLASQLNDLEEAMCICIDAYKDRDLEDPQCRIHDFSEAIRDIVRDLK